jgi:AcrR family transcriptional regulator
MTPCKYETARATRYHRPDAHRCAHRPWAIWPNWPRLTEPRPLRRRSGLLQERSRQTRQRLARAAIDLWTERGFETGIEATTVDEIVHAAGVTKGTFYFHFARKEEILLEMGWETAAVANEEARRCLKAGRKLDDSFARVMHALSRHVRAAPPAAVGRAVAEFRRTPPAESSATDAAGLGQGFEALFARAQEQDELPEGIDPAEMAQMLQALVMDVILDWAAGHCDLGVALRGRTALLLAGLKEPVNA